MDEKIHSLRDRLKKRLGKSNKPLPTASTSSNPPVPPAASTPASSSTVISPPVIVPRTEPGHRIYDAAIATLEEDDQAEIKALVVHEDIDGIKGVQIAVLAQQKKCDDERWTMKVKGNDLRLGAVAGSLSQLLDQIQPGIDFISQAANVVKPGIDLAASVDPLHIGLPIALMKGVLEILVFSSDQMETLLSAVKTAAYMLTQLSLYFEYFARLGMNDNTMNMEQVLVSSYATVLGFLAVGHRTMNKRGPQRIWQLLLSKDTVKAFEANCNAAGVELERAANLCSRDGVQREMSEVKARIAKTLESMKKLDIIQATIQALDVKVDLQRLKAAGGAAYDFVDSQKEGTIFDYCVPGTRQKLIRDIVEWCHSSQQTVFWVCGMAGTGKSTLIRTIARQIEAEGLLAASFFFRQDIDEQKHGALFVSSIVAQLLKKYPILRPHVAAALDADLILPGGPMYEQFTKLLEEPLSQAGLHKLVLVIDALDECRPRDAKITLMLLARLAERLDLQLVVTSRPEPELRETFSNIKPDSIRLEEVKDELEFDIRLFLQRCFGDLVKKDAQKANPQLSGWPDDATINQVVQLTSPLFIFAATLFRYVSEYKPKERLAEILKENQSTSLVGIERVYLPILRQIYGQLYSGGVEQVLADFKCIVGSIILLQNPLSAPALSCILNKPPGDVEEVLDRLYSVLSVPDDHTVPVRILHKSFKDFLLDSDHEFTIDVTATNNALLEGCLELMEGRLHKDICSVIAPGTKRNDVTNVSDYIQPELEYACLYWVSHIKGSIQDGGRVHQFLQIHFLHWLEALSWLRKLSNTISFISDLQSLVKAQQGTELSAFLNDARRFVLRNRHVIDLAPLQSYTSALIFTPTQSFVRKFFQEKHNAQWPSLRPEPQSHWSAEILRLEGHQGQIRGLAFARKGRLLASSASDSTARLWDVTTGEQLLKFRHPPNEALGGVRINTVTILEDGEKVSSVSPNGVVRVWSTATGEMPLRFGLKTSVRAIATSEDGEITVSGSEDGIVRAWSTMEMTDRPVRELIGHGAAVHAVAISGDKETIASGSEDKTLRVWSIVTGEQMFQYEHKGSVDAVAVSADGKTLASGSVDGGVQVWYMGKQILEHTKRQGPVLTIAISADGKTVALATLYDCLGVWSTTSGKQLLQFEGHEDWVEAVAISADGRTVASGASDGVIRLWSTTAGGQTLDIERHEDAVSAIAISADRKLVVTGSDDYKVGVWSADTGKLLRNSEGHEGHIWAISISADGTIIASGSSDSTVRLWSVATGEAYLTLKGHEDLVSALAISTDVSIVVSGSYDGTVRVWSIIAGKQEGQGWQGQQLLTYDKHTLSVSCTAISADGERIASSSRDKTIRVWSTATGEQIHCFNTPIHPSEVRFENNDEVLETDVGRFDLIKWTSPERTLTSWLRRPKVALRDEWIQYHGSDVLWLPHEYRGHCYKNDGLLLVVGHRTRGISVFNMQDVGQHERSDERSSEGWAE